VTSMLLRLPVSVRRWRQIPSAVNGSADAIRAIVNFLTVLVRSTVPAYGRLSAN
jgi:hypothetical protein